LVWFGLVWFGLVWFGLVWFGLQRFLDVSTWLSKIGLILYSPPASSSVMTKIPNLLKSAHYLTKNWSFN
jgi:hypothetical protein